MKIPNETAERMITGSIKEIWDTFINLEDEYDEWEKDYKLVKYGIKVVFPIYWIWKENGKIIPLENSNEYEIDKRGYSEDSYETEKETRRKIMIRAILENVAEHEVLQPR